MRRRLTRFLALAVAGLAGVLAATAAVPADASTSGSTHVVLYRDGTCAEVEKYTDELELALGFKSELRFKRVERFCRKPLTRPAGTPARRSARRLGSSRHRAVHRDVPLERRVA